MASDRPGIVIIPGGFHVPAHYSLLQNSLEQAGYSVVTVSLPSNNNEKPTLNIHADTEAIQKEIKRFIDQDKNVLLVMHSVGGVFGAEACKGHLPTDQPNGKGITSLVYLAAFVPDVGISCIAAMGGPSPWVTLLGEPGTGVFMHWDNPPDYYGREVMYNDCSDKIAADAIGKLVHFSESIMHHECSYAPWKEVESNYLMCELDRAIPAEAQPVIAGQEDGKWKSVEWIRTGHSPFLSMPEETARFVRRCAGEEL